MANPYQLISIEQVDGLAAALEAATSPGNAVTYANNILDSTASVSTDWWSNTAIMGFSAHGSGVTGFPSSNGGETISFKPLVGAISSTYQRTMDLHFSRLAVPDAYIRFYNSLAEPGPWRKLWDSVNLDPTLKLDVSAYTAADVLSKLLTVDGSGSGLDADTLDGYHASSFVMAGSTYVNSFNTRTGAVTLTSGDVTAALTFTPLNATAYTAADVLSKLLTVDGAGTGLDADLLDGQHGSWYANSTHTHTFASLTSKPTTLSGYGITDALSLAGGTLTGNITISKAGPAITLDDTAQVAPSPTGMFRFYSAANNLYLTRNTSAARDYATEATIFVASSSTGIVSFSAIPTANGQIVWTAGNDGASSGLDADLLDGQQGSYYLAAGSYTAADVLSKLLTVDGASSGLDADLLDGQQGSWYANSTHTHTFASLTSKPTTLAGYGIVDAVASSSYTAADVLSKLLTVDGAASGLDADLLDGQQGSWYSDIPSRLGYTPIDRAYSSNNWDTPPAYTTIISNAGGFNGGSTSFGISIDYATNWKMQLAARNNELYFRTMENTVMGSWFRMWHEGSDGSGSGLDADLLDGLHASAFGQISTTNSWAGTQVYTQGNPISIRNDSGYIDWYNSAQSTRRGYIQHSGTAWSFTNETAASSFNLNTTGGGQVLINNGTVWHSLNDGASSGLDADLLDGFQASYFANTTHVHAIADVTGLSAQLAAKAPLASPSLTGAVTITGPRPLVQFNDNSYSVGSALGLYEMEVNGDLAIRRNTSTNRDFSTSEEDLTISTAGVVGFRVTPTVTGGGGVWHPGNDGAASGLDADLLDGVQGATYMRVDQNNTFTNIRYGLVGVYDAAQTQAIWSMGASYTLPVGGASNNYGSHYGLAWSYNPDYGGAGNNPQSKAGLNHQLLIQLGGVTQTAIGSGIWTSGNITATGGSVLTQNIYTSATNGNGLYLWSDPGYSVSMSEAGAGGRVTSETASDYNMYFKMRDGTNRGFVFKAGASAGTVVAGIDGIGNIRSKGFVKASAAFTDLGTTLGSTLSSRYAIPGGASYTTQLSSVTGAIKIRLPTIRSSAMMKMRVEVFNYATSTSKTFVISGYPYDSGGSTMWVNITAEQFGETSAAFNVRFGHDGVGDCVWIGEVGTVWQYPQVFVTEFMHGYSGHSDAWTSNWSVTMVTSFNTVSAGPRSCAVSWNSINDGAGSGLDADYLDGYNSSTSSEAASTIPVRDSSGYLNQRVIRNTSGGPADGMYIGYANAGSGLTRIYGGGSSNVSMRIGASYPVWFNGSTEQRLWYSGGIETNIWHTSADGVARLYFEASSHTYIRSNATIHFMNAGGSIISSIDSSGNLSAIGNITATGTVSGTEHYTTSGSYFRALGTGGFYCQTYDGGWNMTDGSWIRSIANKGILTGGAIQGATVTATSDRRLKTDIQPLVGYGEVIDQTSVYSFIKDGTRQWGVIAQEVLETPAALLVHEGGTIHEEDGDAILTVDFAGFTYALLAEVKELRARLALVEARL